MNWDRVQSLELQLQQKDVRVRRLEEELFDSRAIEVQQRQNVQALSEEIEALRDRIQQLLGSRDLARNVAVRLEQENAALGGSVCALCSQVLVPVPVIGEVR